MGGQVFQEDVALSNPLACSYRSSIGRRREMLTLADVNVRVLTQADWPEIVNLLPGADLPRVGTADHLNGFLLPYRDHLLISTVALESYGSVGLLRHAGKE